MSWFSFLNPSPCTAVPSDTVRVKTPLWDLYKAGGHLSYSSEGTHVRLPLAEVVQALVDNSNLRYVEPSAKSGHFKLKDEAP